MKAVTFLGDSLECLRAFPKGPRNEAGYQLERVQRGLEPQDWKPMTTIGNGVREIRVRGADGAYRVIYTAVVRDAVYVLQAFKKKTRTTSRHDIEIAAKRLRELKRGVIG